MAGPSRPPALRRLVRRLRGPEGNARRAYARWQAEVEPPLRAGLRVQRFGQPTRIAGADVKPATVAVVEDPASLSGTRAPWVLVVDPGDRLAPGAAEAFGRAATLAPDAAVITCDEDQLDAAGRRTRPVVRPGPSPDLLVSRDLAGSLVLVRPEAALAAGLPLGGPGWRGAVTRALTGTDGTAAAHVAAVLAHRAPAAPAPARTGRALEAPVRGEPAIEVVVPFRDRPELLDRAIGSLLRETAWARLRVTLVDNASRLPAPEHLVRDGRVRLLRDERTFNFSALCNHAAMRSHADVLVFLNNDTEVVEPGWLERLVGEAQRPDVGAVGPLLTYADGTVQHAGIAVGLFGLAGHLFAGLHPTHPTPFGTATDGTRNCLAVTAACLVIERAKFAAVSGFDESFVVGGQDVDLGLRLTARGLRSLCVTDVRVIHDEARSRGSRVAPTDVGRSEQAYGAFRTHGDPWYSPALTRAGTACTLRMPGEAW